MIALVCFIWSVVTVPFKSRSRLEAENAALRQQVIVLQRKVRGRLEFTNGDRLFFVLLYRWFPSVLKAIVIVRPETVVRASGGFPPLLAMEVETAGRAPAHQRGAACFDPEDELGECALGCAAYPRGTAQARPRRRSVDRRQIHGQDR